MLDRIWRRLPNLTPRALGLLRAVAAGTTLAFLTSLFRPLFKPAAELLKPYLLPLPSHTLAQALVALLSLVVIALLLKLPLKAWRSLELGLIPLQDWVWVPSVAAFWIAYELQHALLAWGSLAFAGLLTAAVGLIGRGSPKPAEGASRVLESDLPVREGGDDLLGRGEIIESLVRTILFEQPEIVAVTGAYGDGKTSFLNLALGKLKRSEESDLPIIVRFSPWLAGDSNALVVSLLNSIVVEIKHRFVIPGLGREAARYARSLLSLIPKTERLKDLIAEPSQEGRVDELAKTIARTGRRVLVVLDDLDRMEAKELETVFKVLRGSDKLSDIAFTFLCAFDPPELAHILQASRPHQNTTTFIEKFFHVQLPLPKIDSSVLRDLLSQKIVGVVARYAPPPQEDFAKSLESIWEGGAGLYFGNLRRIKLFLNTITNSLERMGGEVNIEDFIRLELIRDIAPNLYEDIYRQPELFWNRDFAFEVAYKGPSPLDEKEAEKKRADHYDKLVTAVPARERYVFQLLEDLFPNFASYRQKHTTRTLDAKEAEKAKRIFHPRFFRQYFLLKVPSELFSQRELNAFVSSTKNLPEDKTAEEFNKMFLSIVKEEFKRWHFMHLIEYAFDQFDLPVKRGLCRGMARNSSLWTTDAFELMTAINLTRDTLRQIPDSAGRRGFLRNVVQDSVSDLYTLTLFWRLEDNLKEKAAGLPSPDEGFRVLGFPSSEAEGNKNLLSDLKEMKNYLREHLRARYLRPDAPSVFEELRSLGSGANRIEPAQVLFSWRNLGGNAEAEEREYLQGLLTRRPEDLDHFLSMMFRVDFIDDYTALKPLIDYKELAQLIALHEDKLDSKKVREFRQRYHTENPPSTAPEKDTS